jgi:phage N-6-adenine-methyltransferase
MKADVNLLAYIGKKPEPSNSSISRDSDAWYTPVRYVEMVRDVLGDIDLDPFSSSIANKSIGAKRFFDSKTDAFKQTWFQDQGRVFMNPPYGRKIIDKSIDLFLSNVDNESITQAIVLVNNATETKWFQSLLKKSNALCFPDRRIAFENDDGKHISGNTRGQVFFYFGHKANKFECSFNEIGPVLILDK